MKKLILLALIILIGCMPAVTDTATPTPDDLEILNDNPDLLNPKYTMTFFDTETWGRDFIPQHIPKGYDLYVSGVNWPWKVIYSGTGYTLQPGGRAGNVGFSFEQTLPPGHYAVIVKGFAHVEGPINEYNILVRFWVKGVAGQGKSNVVQYRTNGHYEYILEFDIPEFGTYIIAPHWSFQYATATTLSFIEIHSIQLVEWN